MSEFKLRNYQSECINAVFKAWEEGLRRPAVVLPTGAGKTVIFSALIKQFRGVRHPATDQGDRVMVLVHRDELADQAIRKIRAMLPADVTVGKVKAEDNEVTADVMVCSVQTLANQRRRGQIKEAELGAGKIGLIITDECHHAAAHSYQKVYKAFPGALQLGVTATLARGDGVSLGGVWEEVVFTRSLLWMISQGFLVDVQAKRIHADFDLSGVKRTAGDWQAGDLGRALEEAHADKTIADAYVEHAKDRPGVVFTPTVATAESAAEALNAAGIRTEVVTGETPREIRQQVFERFRTGETQVLCNCMVLTEGFDAPWASCAVIARPTQSQPLYVQMVGRVLRTWASGGKVDALVLDLVGASASNKLRTLIDLDDAVRVNEVRDGETLAEAVIREEEAAGQVALPGSIGFELKHKEVDLFAGSDAAWLRTPAGVQFVEAGEHTVFLWPEKTGGWSVCRVRKGRSARWERTDHQGVDLAMAMAWGEAVAEELGLFNSRRSARWRKSAPSPAQLDYAERVGISTSGLNKGAVSDALAVHHASKTFDRFAGNYQL